MNVCMRPMLHQHSSLGALFCGIENSLSDSNKPVPSALVYTCIWPCLIGETAVQELGRTALLADLFHIKQACVEHFNLALIVLHQLNRGELITRVQT